MRIQFEREEALACIVVLERRKKLGEWDKSALRKLLHAMNMKPKLDR